jgi:hypothetical protein
LHIDAEAPAFPAPFKLGYSLTVPAFSPSVGFVQTGNSYAAVVTWAGQQIKIDNAFVLPQPRVKFVAGLNVLADTARCIHLKDISPRKVRLGRTPTKSGSLVPVLYQDRGTCSLALSGYSGHDSASIDTKRPLKKGLFHLGPSRLIRRRSTQNVQALSLQLLYARQVSVRVLDVSCHVTNSPSFWQLNLFVLIAEFNFQ